MELKELAYLLTKCIFIIYSTDIQSPILQKLCSLGNSVFHGLQSGKKKSQQCDALIIHHESAAKDLRKLNSFISQNKCKNVDVVIYCGRICTDITRARSSANLIINTLKSKHLNVVSVKVIPGDARERIVVYKRLASSSVY